MKKWVKNGALFLLALVAAFVVVEGLSSVAIFGFDVLFRPNPGLSSRKNLQYDERLGWIGIPNHHDPDQYGPGVSLTINSQSFRQSTDVPDEVPAGMVRVLCSGDSFTFGFGVGDGQTWCDRLAELEPRFETVNMAETGYGVGQAFLKYERDAAPLEYGVHVFAFISDDFRRLGLTRYVGWPKPFVTVRDGNLAVEGVPVPHHSFFRPWYTYNEGRFEALRSLQLGRRLLQRIGSAPADDAVREKEAQIRSAALKVFERTAKLNAEKGSEPVFVFLAMSIPQSDRERDRIRFLETELAALGLRFIDLATEFRALPYRDLYPLFDPATGHYSVRGHEVVAQLLHERLMADPAIRSRLAGASSATPVAARPAGPAATERR